MNTAKKMMKKKKKSMNKKVASSVLLAAMCAMNSMPLYAADVTDTTDQTSQVVNLADNASDAKVSLPSLAKDALNPNIPLRDKSGTMKYWYGGNAFYALNQISDNNAQSDSAKNTYIPFYQYVNKKPDKNTVTTIGDTVSVDGKTLNVTNNGTSLYSSSQNSNCDFSKVWELMDTDATFDGQAVPTGGSAIEALSSKFSTAEKTAMKSVFADKDFYTFLPSMSELFRNPKTVESLASQIGTNALIATSERDDANTTMNYYFGKTATEGYSHNVFVRMNGDKLDGYGVGYETDDADITDSRVFPSIYLNTDNLVMAKSAAKASDNQSNDGITGLVAYDENTLDTSKGIKFLVNNDGFATKFSSDVNAKSVSVEAGCTYAINYENATAKPTSDASTYNNGKADAGNEYALTVSAALYDETGNIVYYGPLSRIDESNAKEGTVQVTIPSDIAEGKYTMALFEEQLGGMSDTTDNATYETDYQSDGISLTALTVTKAVADDVKGEHTVKFETNGGSAVESLKVKDGETVAKPVDPTKDNCKFAGWYTDKNLTKEFKFDQKITDDMTLYAKWDDAKGVHTVKFETNSGSAIESVEVKDGETVAKPVDPTRDGYTFKGWYSDSNLTKEFDFSQKIMEDTTIYAKWDAAKTTTHTFRFNSRGGSSVDNQSIKDGETATKPADPTRNGYTFKGWYADSNLTKEFDFSQKIMEDTTVYAKWEIAANNNTTTNNGGTNGTGMTNTGNNVTGTVATSTTPTTTTTIATIATHTIRFDSNGGSAVSTQAVKSGATVTKPADPTRDGYTFAGWYTDASLINTFDFNTKVTSDMTLYAKWNVAPAKANSTNNDKAKTTSDSGESETVVAAKTGDTNPIIAWVTAGIASLAGLGALIFVKKRHSTENPEK